MGKTTFSASKCSETEGEGSKRVKVPLPTASLHWPLKSRETCFCRLGIWGWQGGRAVGLRAVVTGCRLERDLLA